MEIITRAKLERAGAQVDPASLAQMTGSVRDTLDSQSTALFATARLWDDGLIDPRDTRKVLGFTLAVCREAERRTLRPNTFGVARM